MGDYNLENAKDEAFDLLEDFLDGNHFETGQKAFEASIKMLQSEHLMPLDDGQAREWAFEYFSKHVSLFDLSGQLKEDA
jgi:hypothetical protein